LVSTRKDLDMLRRLAASLLSLTLLSSVASARDFARAPETAAAGAPAPRQMRPPADDQLGEDELMPREAHAPSRALVVKALTARRAANLARFHAYRTRGIYPHDTVAHTSKNIWRDDEGHLCAAATIIRGDHRADLVEDTAAHANGVKLGEVTSGPLLDWILTSGFTQVEIATIQEPMMGPREMPRPRDNSWRIAEDTRLRRKYARIEATLRVDGADAIQQAADRLLENPDLAWALVGAHFGGDAPSAS
jgi:hypothetical protein